MVWINKYRIFGVLITFIMLTSFQTLQPNSVAPSLHSECDKPSGLGFNFMEEKICNKCKSLKPIDRFSSKKSKAGKLYYELGCKDCRNKELITQRQLKNNIEIPDLPNEEWIPVLGYEDHYLISNLSRVKSVYREVPFRNGIMRKVSQLRRPDPNDDGYLQVVLTKDKKSKTLSLHLLMAKSFGLPNPNNLPEVNHKDGDKLNNLIENFEWSTHGDNMRHAVKMGLRKYGNSDSRKKNFTVEEVMDIYLSSIPSGKLAEKYKVTKSSIQRIKNGKSYSKITKHKT